MRKKLDTRFPAARIKKIMQADEEVGKIAMATPVLISKALELFLQDLCDRTYDITLKRGAKTMNSHHLKECVRSHSVFDFLRETVSRVPDLDAESAGGGETTTGRRRKAVDCDNDESCEEDFKRPRSEFQPTPSRGRGRGRGRGRRSNNDKTRIGEPAEKAEENDDTPSPPLSDDSGASPKSVPDDTTIHEGETSGAAKDMSATASGTASANAIATPAAETRCPKDFDLNMELDENGEVAPLEKEEEYHSQWLGAGVQSSYTDLKLHHEQNVFQPEEDYDCEDEE